MITINAPKVIDFRKLHAELFPYLGRLELSGDVLTIDASDDTAAMQIYNDHNPDVPLPRLTNLTPTQQIILADGIDVAQVVITGEPGATVEYTINGTPQSIALDPIGREAIELTSDTPGTVIVVQAGTARAVVYAVEVPS